MGNNLGVAVLLDEVQKAKKIGRWRRPRSSSAGSHTHCYHSVNRTDPDKNINCSTQTSTKSHSIDLSRSGNLTSPDNFPDHPNRITKH